MSGRVGSLFLVIAASGGIFYVIKATRFGEIFTDWTRQLPEALVLALPLYVALLGTVLPAVPISLLLNRGRFGPRPVRAAALITAILAAVAFVLMTIAAYDSMWAMYMGTASLDAPPLRPLLPREVLAVTFPVGTALMGGWMGLTSLQLAAGGVSRVLCVFGVVTGVAVIATTPYFRDEFVFRSLLPLEFTLSLLWAAAVGVYRRRTMRVTVTA